MFDEETGDFLRQSKHDRDRRGSAQRYSGSTVSFFSADRTIYFHYLANMTYCSKKYRDITLNGQLQPLMVVNKDTSAIIDINQLKFLERRITPGHQCFSPAISY
jgi:hypothetical protein